MNKDLFKQLDLNLLRIFLVLSQELNLRKTAERLNVTQPAISRSLQKLRDQFNDELFVKSQQGVRPTAKAEQLAQSLPPIMELLADTVNYHNGFDPKELSGSITLVMNPILAAIMSDRLFKRLHAQAPSLTLQFEIWRLDTPDRITNGDVLCGLNYHPIELNNKELIDHPIGQDTFTIYCCHNHPHKGDSISIEDFIKYPIATMVPQTWNRRVTLTEQLLAQMGLEANIVLRNEQPKAIIDSIQDTNILFPSSSFLKTTEANRIRALTLDISQLPIQAKPDISMIYHYRNRANPMMEWLKEHIKQEFNNLFQSS